jgi:hypothetical protein
MQKVEHYLKDLFYTYDCVTIPGLGGFIMQSQSSRIDKEKNRIYPPSRYPSFNSLLSHDDGLLISNIARAEKISYHDSGLLVNEFAENCKRGLALGEIINLEGIGKLSSNPEGGIQFRHLNHANFHPGVFGMDSLNLYPIFRKKSRERLTQKPDDRKISQPRAKQPASVRWTLIVSLPVILFLLYGIIFPASVQDLYRNYSGLLIDLVRPEKVQQPVLSNFAVASETLIIKTPAPSQNTIVPEEKPLTASVSPVQPSLRYYIVGGCFMSEENAAKFLQDLIGRGFEAERAGSNNRGQIRISYKSFPDRTAALSYLQLIKNEENPSAWLLKY